ncbi:OmpA family protein [Spirosoma taeanense]|uniref:OmpA family protein n=1 Tax=Spirosoma taeanense TaxID=2735870 RepID=A0A6M5YAC7_9BACT|nr:OmpA family protein [Spirosoma taeanense]QJW90230.1 OmpA family protein [Spirosoma taeanense]
MFTSKTPWVILLVLWMIGSIWWHVCRIKQVCPDDALPTSETAAADLPPAVGPEGLLIADSDRFLLTLPGNFAFARSGALAGMNRLGGSLDSLTSYLKANPDRVLTIIGYFTTAETNSTPFASLGLARAEGLKQYFVQHGVPAASLLTKGVEQSDLMFTPQGDSLYGGLAFTFASPAPADSAATDTTSRTSPAVATTTVATTIATASAPVSETAALPTTEEGLAAAEKFTSVFEPIDLYFPLSGATYIRTPETQKFFDEAAKYLAKNRTKKLLITGHTDNSGPDEVNLRLSRDRANQVKAQLRKSGIESGQITVDAKGETQPKADNATFAGRKANRRVTVVVH